MYVTHAVILLEFYFLRKASSRLIGLHRIGIGLPITIT